MTWLALGGLTAVADEFVAPSATAIDPRVEARVESLLSQLTLPEKISLISGNTGMTMQPIERLGIPSLKFSDGPLGVRCWGASTAYPAGVLLAATWDRDAAVAMGTGIGRDARARGVHIMLGPGMNIYREAQNGRNFEYFGEDPYLASAMAVGYVRGLQDQDVAACIKHYVANGQEEQRGSINTIVSRRALEEIYLPPFRAAIEQGGAWTLMASYNKVNGSFATANRDILTGVLRDEWHYQGVVMSDWGAIHDTLGPLQAGTDLEMDGLPREFYSPEKIQPLLDSGALTMATLDEHVRRILRMMASMGFLGRPQTDSTIPLDDPQSAAIGLRIASEGIVLLKNEKQLLPLDPARVKRIVVVGPNTQPAVIGGGGSSRVGSFTQVSVLDALKAEAGTGVQIDFIPSPRDPALTASPLIPENKADGDVGLSAEYFSNPNLQGTPVLQRVDHDLQFDWNLDSPAPGIPGGSAFSVRWRGIIRPGQTGSYALAAASDDGSRVFLDGKKVIDLWGDHSTTRKETAVTLEQGRDYHVVIEYYNAGGNAVAHFGWALNHFSADETQRIASADAVVFAGGLNPDMEHEGDDRPWGLPSVQAAELTEIAKLNPRLIVAVNAGGNLSLGPLLDKIPALLWAWYPGQNGNTALAKIIFGTLNPSGHLPDTFEKRFEDSPAFGNYPGDHANGGTVRLDEGIYVGYRWYDKKKIEPQFPFGFGLSYTSFALKNLRVATGDIDHARFLTVKLDATNTGARAGDAVVQLYVRPVGSTIDRPVKELKGFARVSLQPGETKPVTLSLTAQDFATFDEKAAKWITPPGPYELAVGTSSRDIAQTARVSW
jgi:beta-glucosidase